MGLPTACRYGNFFCSIKIFLRRGPMPVVGAAGISECEFFGQNPLRCSDVMQGNARQI